MGMTNVFVELVIIGIGASIWIIEGFLILWGDVLSVPKIGEEYIVILSIPIIAIVYVIGIVLDRISDFSAMKLWGNKCRNKVFGDEKTYYEAITFLEMKSERITLKLEYAKSRIRILRGWLFQLPIIQLFTTILLIKSQNTIKTQDLIFINVVFSFIICLFLFAWIKTQETTFNAIKNQYSIIKNDI